MKSISSLEASLRVFLGWHKARVSCFMMMLLWLFAVKTVNLRELSLAFDSKAQVESSYRRLQRFFATFKIDFVQIARWIFKATLDKEQSFYLVIDRTNWYWGKQKINVFMLGVAYEGMAIPLFWTLLPKAGSSNFKEQKQLINQFIKVFGVTKVKGLLADREFGNGKLFKWLDKKGIFFYIRIKENVVGHVKNKKFLSAKKLFNDLPCKAKKEFPMSLEIFGQTVFLAASRSERGELMIIATNAHPANAVAIYLRRWEIESLFQGLKGRGFRFEETHITNTDRIAKLIALLAIGFVWAHKVGEWKATLKPIIWKQFKGMKRPQYSYFRYGLDHLRQIVLRLYDNFSRLQQAFSLLLPTLSATRSASA